MCVSMHRENKINFRKENLFNEEENTTETSILLTAKNLLKTCECFRI